MVAGKPGQTRANPGKPGQTNEWTQGDWKRKDSFEKRLIDIDRA